MSQYGRAPVHYPCEFSDRHAIGDGQTECFFVEGDSAAKTVNQVRQARWQAVLALQGKPLNASRASKRVVSTNEVFLRIAEALVTPDSASTSKLDRLSEPHSIRYQRVILLMDPDADGIHCGVLMMGFFRRFAAEFVEAGRLWLVRAPMFQFRFPRSVQPSSESLVAYSPDHARAIEDVFSKRDMTGYKKIKHRGLGSIDATLLQRTCVDPTSRQCECLTLNDVDQAVAVFGGST